MGAHRPARRESRSVTRRRRAALLALLAAAGLMTALLVVFLADGSSTKPTVQPTAAAGPAAPPAPLVVALQGPLRIQLPIAQARVTAIAYHGGRVDALPLTPLGRRANDGFLSRVFHRISGSERGGLRYYRLGGGDGPATGVLDVGAAAGTEVYAPVDGTVVAFTPLVLNGHEYGSRIDIQPTDSPSIIVSVSRLQADPALAVGSAVASGASKLGSLIDFSGAERQALARYSRDAGNHAAIEVRPAATLPLR